MSSPTRTHRTHRTWLALALVVLGLVFSGAGHAAFHHEEGEHCEDCALTLTSTPSEPVVVFPPTLGREFKSLTPCELLLEEAQTSEPVRGPPRLI